MGPGRAAHIETHVTMEKLYKSDIIRWIAPDEKVRIWRAPKKVLLVISRNSSATNHESAEESETTFRCRIMNRS
jgi:hypothetical protein